MDQNYLQQLLPALSAVRPDLDWQPAPGNVEGWAWDNSVPVTWNHGLDIPRLIARGNLLQGLVRHIAIQVHQPGEGPVEHYFVLGRVGAQ